MMKITKRMILKLFVTYVLVLTVALHIKDKSNNKNEHHSLLTECVLSVYF